MKKGHVPTRTCVSCGDKKPKGELLRLVLDGSGTLIWDKDMRMPGRGAYVCKAGDCLCLLEKRRKVLSKVLKREIRSFMPVGDKEA